MYTPTFYRIRYILEELYVVVIWIISWLKIYIDQLNTGIDWLNQANQILIYRSPGCYWVRSYLITTVIDYKKTKLKRLAVSQKMINRRSKVSLLDWLFRVPILKNLLTP